VEEILRHVGLWGKCRNRGPPASGARGEAAERRVVVDEYAQVSPPDDVWVDDGGEWGA